MLEEVFQSVEILHRRADDDEVIRDALESVDAAVIRGDVDERYLQAPRLKWIHWDRAGIENSAFPAVFEHGLQVTSSAGRSAPALAEHVLFFMLALSYRSPDFLEAQRAHRWGIRRQGALRALNGASVGIIGMGHTARALLPLLAALDMSAIVYRRSDEPVEGVAGLYCQCNGDTPRQVLEQSDFLVLGLLYMSMV